MSVTRLALIRFVFAVMGIAVLGGCANYQLGTDSSPQFSTLFIAPVKTDALIPQAQVLVTTQLRESFLRDGRVKLVDSPEDADATLQISLIGYDRGIAVTRADDTGLARRFDIYLRAHATLSNNRTKQDYFVQRPITATRGAFTDSGLVPTESQVMPLLAEQLARETVHAVLDTW